MSVVMLIKIFYKQDFVYITSIFEYCWGFPDAFCCLWISSEVVLDVKGIGPCLFVKYTWLTIDMLYVLIVVFFVLGCYCGCNYYYFCVLNLMVVLNQVSQSNILVVWSFEQYDGNNFVASKWKWKAFNIYISWGLFKKLFCP